MLELIGAATVVGSLMYGVEIYWRQDLELYHQQEELATGMDDEKMVQMLKSAGPCSDLPPLALAEIVDLSEYEFIVRRLHLVIVDTWRPPEMARPQQCRPVTKVYAECDCRSTHQKYNTNSTLLLRTVDNSIR